MIQTILRPLATAAAVAAFPLAAAAAPVTVYQTEGQILGDVIPPIIVGDYLTLVPDPVDIALSGDYDIGTEAIAATLFVSDLSGTLLESTSIVSTTFEMLGDGSELLTLVFDGLTGSDAGLFSDGLATVRMAFDVGAQLPAATFALTDVSVEVLATPIPLPAGLPLMAMGLAGLALARRRRG